ncbi:hypothetical protein [Bradyrhizobium sp. CCBAU 25338]|uniref:hypothetical protein n=1 Tax=Bradyrhizobium sp. CCBAU 25338 TaxID=1641877 RepID=UPI002302EC99|nr:hypothetical protein [Bradyrhizobium sp. CCBAU 25338]MDA9529251.1 hypothetical protein [Bradyrhizobium sp. CCBAU 25338]
MNGNNLPGLATIAALMLAAVLTTWLGISGAVISDIDARGILKVIQDWQTLIGVVGAALIGWMAVAPVWRQVRIMAAQAASQLQPILVSDLEAIDADIAFIGEIRAIQNGLGKVSATIDFWEKGDIALVDVLANELLALRASIDRLGDVNWGRFCDRLRLTRIQRTERADLRQIIASIHDESRALTLRQQQGSPDESRMQFLGRIAPHFVRSVHEFIDSTRHAISDALANHEIRLRAERRRLLAKGEEIDRSLELRH